MIDIVKRKINMTDELRSKIKWACTFNNCVPKIKNGVNVNTKLIKKFKIKLIKKFNINLVTKMVNNTILVYFLIIFYSIFYFFNFTF